MNLDIPTIISAMRSAGHEHLIHYAGAAHRDPIAHAMCVAYLADPSTSEPTLKSRVLTSHFGWPVSPADCTH